MRSPPPNLCLPVILRGTEIGRRGFHSRLCRMPRSESDYRGGIRHNPMAHFADTCGMCRRASRRLACATASCCRSSVTSPLSCRLRSCAAPDGEQGTTRMSAAWWARDVAGSAVDATELVGGGANVGLAVEPGPADLCRGSDGGVGGGLSAGFELSKRGAGTFGGLLVAATCRRGQRCDGFRRRGGPHCSAGRGCCCCGSPIRWSSWASTSVDDHARCARHRLGPVRGARPPRDPWDSRMNMG